ncbi:MAG TPA: hypothetical protein VHP14_01205, partial [Anaerolineales bacterium]|nr:hypothetical protein [Anaerolineales bacterium]
TATSYLVRYSTSPIDAGNWATATPVTTGIPTPLGVGAIQSMTVNGLIPGVTYYFAVRAQDEEPNLGGMSTPAFVAAQSPAPEMPGTYDDAHAAWIYSGNWIVYTGADPASNTLHYTTTVGDSASFVFTGTKFTLTFTKYSNRGTFEVWLDDTTLVTTIDASSPTLQWQQTYASPTYANTTHTVTIKHVGPVGTIIDIDAILTSDTP